MSWICHECRRAAELGPGRTPCCNAAFDYNFDAGQDPCAVEGATRGARTLGTRGATVTDDATNVRLLRAPLTQLDDMARAVGKLGLGKVRISAPHERCEHWIR